VLHFFVCVKEWVVAGRDYCYLSTMTAYLSILFKCQEILTKYLLNILWLGKIFPILWLKKNGFFVLLGSKSTLTQPLETHIRQVAVCRNHYGQIIIMTSPISHLCLLNMRKLNLQDWLRLWSLLSTSKDSSLKETFKLSS
jgi:hypothetical protein